MTRSNVGYNGAVRADAMDWCGNKFNDFRENLSFKTATDGSTLVCTQQQLSDFRSEFSKKMNRNAVPVFKKRTGTPFRCVPVQFEPCLGVWCIIDNR